MWSLVQIQVVSLMDCSSARIFVLSAASRGRGAEGKVAWVGDTAEGQRFVSFSRKPKVKNAVLDYLKSYLKLDE